MVKNVIIVQSGGISPVINNSLRAIVETCKMFPDVFGKIYAGWHGIEGVLKEELLDLSAQEAEEIALLRTTPATGSIGTSRYKILDHQTKDLERIIEIIRIHNVGYLFCIGGDDTQHLALKIDELARNSGYELITTGIPKAVNNDFGDPDFKLIDHTPGYGSIARYWQNIIWDINEENLGTNINQSVFVVQSLGRKSGFIAAAARLADPNRQMPIQIYMSESPVNMAEIADNVNDQLQRENRCIVVVGDTYDFISEEKTKNKHDFCYVNIVDHLNEKGFQTKELFYGQLIETDQRRSAIYASIVDLSEAYKLGQKAVEIALNGESGFMSTIIRDQGFIYNVRYEKIHLSAIDRCLRLFPEKWISENKRDVSDDFVKYAHPLIGEDWVSIPTINGIQRFARLKPFFAPQKSATYQPEVF